MTVGLASYKGMGILLLHLFHFQITTILDNRSVIGVLLGGPGYNSNLYKHHFYFTPFGGHVR